MERQPPGYNSEARVSDSSVNNNFSSNIRQLNDKIINNSKIGLHDTSSKSVSPDKKLDMELDVNENPLTKKSNDGEVSSSTRKRKIRVVSANERIASVKLPLDQNLSGTETQSIKAIT